MLIDLLKVSAIAILGAWLASNYEEPIKPMYLNNQPC